MADPDSSLMPRQDEVLEYILPAERYQHPSEVLATHHKYISAFLRATRELLAKDATDMALVEKVTLRRGNITHGTKEAEPHYFTRVNPRGAELRQAVDFGTRQVSFAFQSAGGEKLTVTAGSIKEGEHHNEVAIKLPLEMTADSYEGELTIRPKTGMQAKYEMLTLLDTHPECFPVHTAVTLMTLKEEDIVPGDDSAFADTQLNTGQRRALAQIMANPVTLVWGPPGTGKSTLIAEVVNRCVAANESGSLISNTNYAVDSVAEKIARRGSADMLTGEGKASTPLGVVYQHMLITRIGTPENPRPLKMVALANRKAKYKQEGRLSALPTLEQTLMTDKFTLATCFRFLSHRGPRDPNDQELSIPQRDVMIVDEVSTVDLPTLYMAGCFARKRLVLVGDPRQLPMVYPYQQTSKRTTAVYSTDIFSVLRTRINPGQTPDPRICALWEQRRMVDGLADLVRKTNLYPRYETPAGYDKTIPSEVREAIALPPLPGQTFVVVDTSRYMTPQAVKHANMPHQDLVCKLLRYYYDRSGVSSLGVVCPYRRQAQGIASWVESNEMAGVTVGTAHAFQGSEAPLIIWDTVEGPPPVPSEQSKHFFTDEIAARGGHTLNLLNVSVSRAQGKIVLVGNVRYLAEKMTKGCYIHRLLREACDRGAIIPADYLLQSMDLLRDGGGAGSFPVEPVRFPGAELMKVFREDLARCRHNIRIRSASVDREWFFQIMRLLRKHIHKRGIMVHFYMHKRIADKALKKMVAALVDAEISVSHLSYRDWPHGDRVDITFDDTVFYDGAPSFLGKKVNLSVRRFVLPKKEKNK